jgi:hypothetical protein
MFRCLLVSFSGLAKVESSSQPFTVLGMNTSGVEAVLQAETFDKHRSNIGERIEYHLKCLEVASYLTFHVCSNPAVVLTFVRDLGLLTSVSRQWFILRNIF